MKKNGKYFLCPICGKSFYRSMSRIKRGVAKYCSFKCHGKFKVGIPNYSNRHKGNTVTFSCDECGDIKKVRLAIYSKAKNHFCSNHCAAIHLGRLQSKENHWNWKGGITLGNRGLRHSSEYIEWRNVVYKRDNYICQHCDIKCISKEIIAHHIKSFNEYPNLRHVASNGLVLCRNCHKKVHSDIGIETRFSV